MSQSRAALAIASLAFALAPGACGTIRTTCPGGTEIARKIYSGGGEAEWCRRPDGVRQGPETRYYESGAELASGGYVDGAMSGVWRYRFNDGRNWRADRWDDGALVAQTVDPAVAAMSSAELEALGPTTSGIIKLTSNDPLLGRQARERPGATFVGLHPNGRPRAAGSYDADGLRTGVWRFWYPDGRPEREVEYLAGVRERIARAWHPNGAPAADGFYLAGERDGRWRWWDASGRYLGEARYQAGKKVFARAAEPAAAPAPPRPATDGGMLGP
jgi:antitoxin component YwqK of YwqJK toxin-antitoxin module